MHFLLKKTSLSYFLLKCVCTCMKQVAMTFDNVQFKEKNKTHGSEKLFLPPFIRYAQIAS